MIFVNRQERLQVLYSLLGLVCAIVAAAMILALAVPHSRPVIIDEDFRIPLAIESDRFDGIVEQSTRLGGRRLATATSGSSSNSHSHQPISFTPQPLTKAIFNTTIPTSLSIDMASTSDIDILHLVHYTLPTVVIGAAGIIILFTLLLYCCDLARWKEQLNESLETPDGAGDKNVTEIDTSAGSTEADGSDLWVTAESPNKSLLPPLHPDEEQPSEIGLFARLSTMTNSIEDTQNFKCNETSSEVTELSHENLVGNDTLISSLMLFNRSDSASLTSKEEDQEEGYEFLLGEKCLDDVCDEDIRSEPTFTYSPSSNGSEGEEALPRFTPNLKGLSQMNQVVSAAPDDYSLAASLVVRDIYYVPGETQSSLGLDLITREYPTIAKVYPSSTFAGRVFCGDSVLSINNVDMHNISAGEALDFLNRGRPVRIKLKSSEKDGTSDIETQAGSLDLAVAVEV